MFSRLLLIISLIAGFGLLVSGSFPVHAQESPATPSVADSSGIEPTAMTKFNRELVGKVKKGCIYIWAMSPGDTGFLAPMWIGSGVIFMAVPEENAAYALTNHHVANDTTLLQCEGWDNATYKAYLVATEPGIDCALIRIEDIPRENYEPCVLGNSDLVQNGEFAMAVGAPGYGDAANTERSDPNITFGLHQSTTMAVVSGRATNPYQFIGWWSGWQYRLGHQVMTNCPWRFVMESAISGGNSGGPLFNAKGECIGLNHAHFGAGAQITQHENYSIPINFCKNFAFQILDTGKYELPWFGLDLLMPPYFDDPQGVGEFVERHMNDDVIEIFGVRNDSPAERSGVEIGDIIEEFDGRVFSNLTELRLYIFDLEIGQEIPVVVSRGKQEIELTMEVGVKRSYNSEFSY